ncbi:MAG: hypothetical protein QXO15_03940 [Nitrososphaerota archaeon]
MCKKEKIFLLFLSLLLTLIVYVTYVIPIYDKIGWNYPFGWDTAAYVATSKYILTWGSISYLKNISYYPNLYYQLVALISFVTSFHPLTIETYLPVILFGIFIYVISFLTFNLTRSLLASTIAMVITSLSPSTLILLSHLHRNFTALILNFFILNSIAKYYANSDVRKDKLMLAIVGLISVITSLTWLMSAPFLVAAIIVGPSFFLFFKIIPRAKMTNKLKRTLLALFPMLLIYLTYQIIFYDQFIGAINIERPPYTILSFIFYSGNNIFLSVLEVLGTITSFYLVFYKKQLNFIPILSWTGACYSNIIFGLTEVKNRVSILVPHGILIAIFVRVLITRINYHLKGMILSSPSNKNKVRDKWILTLKCFIYYFLCTFLVVLVIYSSILGSWISYENHFKIHVFRRWATKCDDRPLFEALETLIIREGEAPADECYYIVIVTKKENIISPFMLQFYIRSFIPRSFIIYFPEAEYGFLPKISELYSSELYLDITWKYIDPDKSVEDTLLNKKLKYVMLPVLSNVNETIVFNPE